ncbi:hypothetical protein VNI00_010878 [Paramarasmius palmivorus]|uniref:Uncharacterized protein n=1 Tax=Paramarasmius palmivorus TaxID=297713 RepID=A0AAW0CFB6_9AGAR
MKVSTQHAAAWLKNDSAVYMTWYQYKIKWERSMTEFRELLDAGSREYFFFSKSNLLWTAFRSEVETEEIPTLDGLQRAVKVVNHLNEGSWYGSLNRRLVNDLESVVKGFPVWRDVEG